LILDFFALEEREPSINGEEPKTSSEIGDDGELVLE
jgi:hypothetical protein